MRIAPIIDIFNESPSGWIKFPSTHKNPEMFGMIKDELKTFSRPDWSVNSKTGDAFVYVEKGEPLVRVELKGNRVTEIQADRQGKVPFKHVDRIENLIKQNKLNAGKFKGDIYSAKKSKVRFDKLKTELTPLIESEDFDGILKKFKIRVKRVDGKRHLSRFGQPDRNFNWEDLGIASRRLLKDVFSIRKHKCFG